MFGKKEGLALHKANTLLRKDALVVFGENIREYREQEGKTLMAFAKEIGYNRLDLAKLEYGEKDIKINTAIKIAKHIDVYLPRLFSETEFTKYLKIDSSKRLGYVEDDYVKIFIARLSEYLGTRGMQAIISTNSGMDPSNVSKILHYQVKNPCISTLDTLAGCVGKEFSILISRTDDLRVEEEET